MGESIGRRCFGEILIQMRKLSIFFGESLAVMVGIYFFYYIMGFAYLNTWTYGIRNIIAGALVLFLAQIVTQRVLHGSVWRIALLPFLSWVLVFGYVQSASADGWAMPIESMNKYFLTSLAGSVCMGILLCQKERWNRIYLVCKVLTWGLLLVFLGIAAVYWGYYLLFDIGFTPADMVTLLLTNKREAMEFLDSHLGIWGFHRRRFNYSGTLGT